MSLAHGRSLRLAALLATSGALVLGSSVAADANGPARPAAAPQQAAGAPGGPGGSTEIRVDMTAAGFSLPRTVPAGLVTFRVTSPDVDYHALQGFRVNPGATVEQVMQDFVIGNGDDPAGRAAGATALNHDATLVGGVVTSAAGPISATFPLEPGTYHFFDLNDLFTPGLTPRLHTLSAVGRMRPYVVPSYDAVIVTTMYMDPATHEHLPIFGSVPSELPANGTFFVINTGDEIHEAVFRGARPGITDEYVTEFYDAVLNGTPRPPSPWTEGNGHGLQAISPNRWAVLHIELPPALYALICYVPSDETGIPHAYIGMHEMVTLS